jgi:hypothetical protein
MHSGGGVSRGVTSVRQECAGIIVAPTVSFHTGTPVLVIGILHNVFLGKLVFTQRATMEEHLLTFVSVSVLPPVHFPHRVQMTWREESSLAAEPHWKNHYDSHDNDEEGQRRFNSRKASGDIGRQGPQMHAHIVSSHD